MDNYQTSWTSLGVCEERLSASLAHPTSSPITATCIIWAISLTNFNAITYEYPACLLDAGRSPFANNALLMTWLLLAALSRLDGHVGKRVSSRPGPALQRTFTLYLVVSGNKGSCCCILSFNLSDENNLWDVIPILRNVFRLRIG